MSSTTKPFYRTPTGAFTTVLSIACAIVAAVILTDSPSAPAPAAGGPVGTAPRAAGGHCAIGAKRAECVLSRDTAATCRLYACYTCDSEGSWGLSSTSTVPCTLGVTARDRAGQLATSNAWHASLRYQEDTDEP